MEGGSRNGKKNPPQNRKLQRRCQGGNVNKLSNNKYLDFFAQGGKKCKIAQDFSNCLKERQVGKGDKKTKKIKKPGSNRRSKPG